MPSVCRPGKMLANRRPRWVSPTAFPFSNVRTSERVFERNAEVEIVLTVQE